MTRQRSTNSVFCTWSYRSKLPPSTRSQFRELDHFVRTLCSSARSQLILVAPYLSPAGLKTLRNSIAKSVQNGAWVRLITGDLAEESGFNRRAIKALLSGEEGTIIKPRLRILAGSASMPQLLHAKIILCDNAQGYLGSANLSQSALDKNFEVGVALGSGQVRALERLFSFFEAQGLIEDCSEKVVNV